MPPLALSTGWVILIALAALLLAALAYIVLLRDNPRQHELDAEREEVVEELPLKERVDFEADLRPPESDVPTD
jgi:hypothetical protein